jgi:hypothetical protein
VVLSISISISRHTLAKQPHPTMQVSNTRLKLLASLSFVAPVCAFPLLGVVNWLDVGLVLGFHHFNPSLVSTNFASCYGYLVGGLGFRAIKLQTLKHLTSTSKVLTILF